MTALAFPKPTMVRKAAKPLRRRKPINRVNRKRRAERYTRNFGERGDAVREMPCLLACTKDCDRPVEAAHASARGMGGV